MLRLDLEQSLLHSDLHLEELSPFQRILLTTDGTVTEILEAQFWEPITLVKLYQQARTSDFAIPYLKISAATNIIVRKILLQGSQSKTNYIYAESILVPQQLDAHLQVELLTTDKPLGRLMIEAKTETFREILTCRMEKAGELGDYFNQATDSDLIARTYRVFTNKKPVMLITEKFPRTSFRDC